MWWQLGSNLPGSGLPARILPLGLTRSSALFLATGAAVLAATGWGLEPAGSRLSQPLALLAGLWLVRVVADPHPNYYYFVPFLIAVGVWETVLASPGFRCWR